MTFPGPVGKVRIDVLCERELRFGGRCGSFFNNFREVFRGHLQGPIQDATFADFDDFGPHLGIPWETFLGPLVDFWGVQLLADFGALSGFEKGGAGGRGGAPLNLQDLARARQ